MSHSCIALSLDSRSACFSASGRRKGDHIHQWSSATKDGDSWHDRRARWSKARLYKSPFTASRNCSSISFFLKTATDSPKMADTLSVGNIAIDLLCLLFDEEFNSF